MKKYLIALSLTIAAGFASAESITIEHAMGETELTKPAVRVVTLYQGATDAAIALEITPVGVVESWVQKPIYEYLRGELEGVTLLGTELQPNLEQIAALQPDVIIASKTRHEKIYDQLTMIAPTVTHETVFKFKETLELIAQATGKEVQAQAWLSNWNDQAQQIEAQLAEKLGEGWPQQVSLLNFRADHARVYNQGFAGLVLTDLGFDRPEAQKAETWGVKLTSQESIPTMDADAAFVFMSMSDQAVMNTYKQWTAHPLWANLNIAKNESAFIVDEVDWNMSGGPIGAQRMVESIIQHYNLND